MDRAASLLIALSERGAEAGVTDLARGIGLHKSTASRLLATLQAHGLVEQDGSSGKYRLGLAMVLLGGHAEKTLDYRSIAMPALETAARTLMEATALVVRSGDGVMTIAWCDAAGTRRAATDATRPLHATAAGKVLLSDQPEREIVRLSRIGFAPWTPNTIVRMDLLLEEMGRVRRRGFATSFGEHEASVNAVAAPVFNQRAAVVAAVEVRASARRLAPSRVPEVGERVREAAAAISERIGWVVASD